MSRLRAPSPIVPRQRQHSTTPIPSPRTQPEPILRRAGSFAIPPSPTSSDRRFVSEEKFQETVRLNAEYENHIRQFQDLLEDTRRKWSQSEEENTRLAALVEELKRQNNEAVAKNNALLDQLSKTGALDSKKLEEGVKKYGLQSNTFNEDVFFKPAPTKEDALMNITFSKTPQQKKKSVLRRSNSVSAPRFTSSSQMDDLSSVSSTTSSAATLAASSSTYDNLDKVNSRRHTFGTKRYYDETRCHACSLKICLGFESLKCTVCETVCHPNCRKDAPSCVPFFEAPTALDGFCLALDDYCSDSFQPKIPHLVIRCVQYLNTKTSFKELYVDLSQDAKAESLMELVLHDPNASNIGKFGPKVAAHCIMKFLSSLKNPLVPESFVIGFLKAAQFPENTQLEKMISELPAVHKNVLAYLILHWKLLLQESHSTGLTEKVLGGAVLPVIMRIPTYEAAIYSSVFHRLLSLPSSFWCAAIDASLLKCPLEGSGGPLYGRGGVKQQHQKQERFGRLWG